MRTKIRYDRLFQNILFYIFYLLLASFIFSFIFPLFLIILWQEIPTSTSSIFDILQVLLAVVLLILSLRYRKYFYLPMYDDFLLEPEEEVVIEKPKEEKQIVEDEQIVEEEQEKELKLDIKIGREIK